MDDDQKMMHELHQELNDVLGQYPPPIAVGALGMTVTSVINTGHISADDMCRYIKDQNDFEKSGMN